MPDIMRDVTHIAKKIPIMSALENKVVEYDDINKDLGSIMDEMKDINDHSDMDAAKIGGQTISAIYKVKDMPDRLVGGDLGK